LHGEIRSTELSIVTPEYCRRCHVTLRGPDVAWDWFAFHLSFEKASPAATVSGTPK
jgi:hypothetical protein